jgi:hypothetical protein
MATKAADTSIKFFENVCEFEVIIENSPSFPGEARGCRNEVMGW